MGEAIQPNDSVGYSELSWKGYEGRIIFKVARISLLAIKREINQAWKV